MFNILINISNPRVLLFKALHIIIKTQSQYINCIYSLKKYYSILYFYNYFLTINSNNIIHNMLYDLYINNWLFWMIY